MNSTIRVFRAPDARAALEAIKSSLGPDAVILGTREVKGGFFQKTEIEVTAGLPQKNTPAPAAAGPAREAQTGLAPLSHGRLAAGTDHAPPTAPAAGGAGQRGPPRSAGSKGARSVSDRGMRCSKRR